MSDENQYQEAIKSK